MKSEIQNFKIHHQEDDHLSRRDNKYNKITNGKNPLVSTMANNFQIVSCDSSKFEKYLDDLDKTKLAKNKIEFEDEQLISILNTNSGCKNDFSTLRKKQELKESSLDVKSAFYEDNLFNLIDEIESKENSTQINNICDSLKDNGKNENFKFDYEIDKRYEIKFSS